ncbi:MAG: L-threonylcarbamoyladenylate synthase [Desulfovibrionaceae bacterium]
MHCVQNILEAKNLLDSGSLCIYPTETFYAMGSSVFSKKIKYIFTIKKRPLSKPLPCIAHTISQITEFAQLLPIHKTLYTLFPSLSIILPLKKRLTYFQDTIVFRLPSTPLLFSLTENNPIISTSANISGCPPVTKYPDLDPLLTKYIDIIITPITQADIPQGNLPSTILYTKQNILYIVREGTTSQDSLTQHAFTVYHHST